MSLQGNLQVNNVGAGENADNGKYGRTVVIMGFSFYSRSRLSICFHGICSQVFFVCLLKVSLDASIRSDGTIAECASDVESLNSTVMKSTTKDPLVNLSC